MSAFVLLRLAHVLAAVLGAGTIAAVALEAGSAARLGTLASSQLPSLTRWATLGFLATFLTGAALDVAAGGAFHEQWWFRIAGLSMIGAGALLGGVRRLVRRAETGDAGPALARARWLAGGACVLVGWIVVLMELRPF